MTKLLDGRELVGFMKERQAHVVATLRAQHQIPKLIIIRDNDNPVIAKYVSLKQRYGTDIGVSVEDLLVDSTELTSAINQANHDPTIHGIIVQLPLSDPTQTDSITSLISPAKDVDGLTHHSNFISATAEAIDWLLAGYNINLHNKQIAIIGQGRLVGAPLFSLWQNSNYQVTSFGRELELDQLHQFDLIVTATGTPRLISSKHIRSGTVVVDAGTASENGILVGDVSNDLRERTDLLAITPRIGGVGPMTIGVLFEHLLTATQSQSQPS